MHRRTRHRAAWIWRFHSIHHGVRRLYGFNGLMKHPVHQLIETGSGMLPLLLLGIPQSVASAVAACVAIQLLLQHSNADYRSGPLKFVFANAEVHRFHHRAGTVNGEIEAHSTGSTVAPALEVRWRDGNGGTRLRSRSLRLPASHAALTELRALLGPDRVHLVRGA